MQPCHRSNTFRFDPSDLAGCSGVEGLPLPPLAEAEAEMFGAMMNHALQQSARLAQRRHALQVQGAVPEAARALGKLQLTTFPVLMEGCYSSVPLLEHATLVDGVLDFTIAEDYATYVTVVGATALDFNREGSLRSAPPQTAHAHRQ